MIRIDSLAVVGFAEQLKGLPQDVQKELQPTLRDVVEPMAQAARSNASWSSRIPGAIKTRVGGRGKTAGVQIVVDRRAAPHARSYEGITQDGRGMFRHPVYGTDVWVDEPTRPFLRPAVQQHESAVVNQIQEAINRAVGRL